MKSILYVAGTLMIGASIYGFVDYSKTKRSREFKTMYEEPEVKKPIVTEEKTLTVTVAPEMVTKKEQPVITKDEPAAKPVKKMKRKRKINYESFSRAPLREKEAVIVPEVKEIKIKGQ